ncbi:MAG: hypothetical protein LW701_01085 [Fluviicola sp.]|jgi:hypothetical protein|nr:hypothetical protein [Fluviicola sp.]
MIKDNYHKFEKGITISVFLFVFSYLLIRVFYNETLHDEIATYMFYIYQGDFKGETIVWDANNHLLNSFIGNKLYPIFKDNISLYRLPNLFAFVLYFFGLRELLKELKTKYLRLIALITFCSLTIIIEYFALCRGYGLSLGFFICALVFLKNYFRNHKLSALLLTYVFLILAISANLTFIVTSLMVFGIVCLEQFIHYSTLEKRQHFVRLLFHFSFLLLLFPFIKFSFELKEHGALYYGSLEGIWDVTGKSLNEYILFLKDDSLMYLYAVLFIVLINFLIKRLFNIKLKDYFTDQFLIHAVLFFGNLVAILFLANVLNVNYPEDRTAFYLVIPFLLMLFYFIDQFKLTQKTQYLFLVFPVIFLFHLNIHSSAFSPEQRMTDLVYNKVKAQIKPSESLMIYQTMAWNWPFRESFQKVKASAYNISNPDAILTDYIITNTDKFNNKNILNYYDTLVYDPANTYIAFKRKVPLIKKLLYTSSPVFYGNLAQEFIPILEEDSLNRFFGKSLQISVAGKLETYQPKNKIQLVLQTFNKENQVTNNFYYSFETTYQGDLINDTFLHHFIFEKITKDDELLKVYLWDRKVESVKLTNANCKFYEIKNPKVKNK